VSLSLRNQPLLDEWLRQVYTSGSANYGHFLSATQFNSRFAPLQSDEDAVVAYLQAQGLQVYKTFDNHSLVRAKGSLSQVERAFAVTINNYKASDGRIFYANAEAPTLPAELAAKVLNVQGLENFVKSAQRQGLLRQPASSSSLDMTTQVQSRATSGAGPGGGLTPSQWQSFYNFSTLYNANIKGQNQVLAIAAFDTFRPGDFTAFLQQYQLPTIPVEIHGAGVQAYPLPGANELEVISDMEMAAAAAPSMSKLVVYEDIDLVTIFQEFVNDRLASVLSDSFGFPCDSSLPTSYLAAQTQVLQQAAAQGQTVVVASGDDLAYSCSNPTVPAVSQNNNPSIGAPDDNPWVLTVGGTSINFSSNPTASTLSYTSESVWNCPKTDTVNNCQGGNYGSTGGVSSAYFNTQPWWQHGVTDATLTTTGRTGRATPDLAFYADTRVPQDSTIEPGYSVYCSDASFCASTPGWLAAGGTSLAAPAVAGALLLANQSKGSSLGFVNPTIYSLGSGGSASSIFHDVTTGTNGAYSATSGWDAATGFGSFDANALVTALKNTTAPTAPSGNNPIFSYYVPFAAGNPKNLANSFGTALYIQNEASTVSTINVTYYSASGASLGSESPSGGTIAGHGQFLLNQSFTGPLSQGNGATAAAVVQSSQPLNIMVTENTPVGASAYNAIGNIADFVDQDSTFVASAALPLATSNVLLPAILNSFIKTSINIFNGGPSTTTVNITYYTGDTGQQVASESRSVAANGSVSIDNSVGSSVVQSGFNGSAVVSSADGFPLAVQVVENRPDINFVASYPGTGIPANLLAAPAIYNNSINSFYTGMNIVNTSSQAVITATITFYKEDGTVVGVQNTGNIAPHGIVGLFQGNTDPSRGLVLPTGLSMSARVQSSGPVAVVVNEAQAGGGSVAGAYSGLLAGASVLNLPTIQANFYGGTSGLVVQNVGSSQASATIQYYDPSGNPVGSGSTLTIAPHGISQVYDSPQGSGLPSNFVGNAVITSAAGTQLVVTCNVSNGTYFYSYTAP
jgi:kumamolisin